VSTLDLYSVYANMGCVAFASPQCICLLVEEPSRTCPDAHNPPGLDKMPWQGNEEIYWLEINEPSYDNIHSEIDRVLEHGYGYCLLIGATREGTGLLLSDQDKPQPLAEIVPIQSDRDVCISWSVNTLCEPVDQLFYGHGGSASESGTDSPINIHFPCRHKRGPSPDASQSSDDDSLEGMNPESSATAVKRALLLQTTTTKNRRRNTGIVQHSVMIYIDEWGYDSNVFYDAGANLASTEIVVLHSNTPPPPGQHSYPTANLNSRILLSGQQTGRGTNMKKVSGLPTWTTFNSSGKWGQGAMTDAGEPNSPADTGEPLRKIVGILPSQSSSPHNSPPLLTSNTSDNEAMVAAEQILIEASALYLLTLASETEQPPPHSATHVSKPSSNHSPADLCSGDVLDMPVGEAGQESTPAASPPASPSSDGLSMPGKLGLQLSGLSSCTLLAAGFTDMQVETYLKSSLLCVSVLA